MARFVTAVVMADKKLPQSVVNWLFSFGNLLDTGANDHEVLFAEAATHQGDACRCVSEKLVLRD